MEELTTICSTCLSSDRTLYQVKALSHLHAELDNVKINLESAFICWECRAILTRMYKFRAQATVAQQLLTRCTVIQNENLCKNKPLQSLTNLTKETKFYFDKEFCNLQDITIKVESEETRHESAKLDDGESSKKYRNDCNYDKSDTWKTHIKEKVKTSELDGNESKQCDNISIKVEGNSDSDDDVLINTEHIYVDDFNELDKSKTKKTKSVYKKRSKNNKNTLKAVLTENELDEIRQRIRETRKYVNSEHKCVTCLVTFKNNKEYEEHVWDKHSEANVHQCSVCKSTFPTVEEWSEHCKGHYSGYRCSQCPYLSTSSHVMKWHVSRIHAAGTRRPRSQRSKCSICHKKLPRCSVEEHMQAEHANKQYDSIKYCRECDIQFKSVKGYKSHMKLSAMHTNNQDRNKSEESFVEREQIHNNVQKESVIDKKTVASGSEDEDAFPKYVTKRLSEEEVIEVQNKLRASDSYKNLKYKCERCVVGFQDEHLYELHVSEKHDNLDVGEPCEICLVRVSSVEMEKHVAEHYNTYQCGECDYTNTDVSCIELHYMKTHDELFAQKAETRYKCKHCTHLPAFKSRSRYQYHMSSRHATQRPRCDTCGKSYTCQATLNRHKIIHKGGIPLVECDVCHKMVRGAAGLKIHKKVVHSTVCDEDAFCIECNKQFKNKHQYKAHLMQNSNHISPDSKIHECPICQKRFVLSSILKTHHRKVHLREYEATCHICGEKFATRYAMKAHIEGVHEGANKRKEKTHLCVICERKFSSKTLLSQHMNTHTGARPYQCKLCPDTFGHKSSLYMHNRLIHLKLKKSRGNKFRRNTNTASQDDNNFSTN